MLKYKNQNFTICLLDTNVLSEILKNFTWWINHLYTLPYKNILMAYSIFSVIELMKKEKLFKEYIDKFSIFPSFVLDGHEGILEKEVKFQLKKIKYINPIVIPTTGIKNKNMSPKEALKYVLRSKEFNKNAQNWEQDKKEILKGILSLKKNYPSNKKKYSKSEIELFVEKTTVEQIKMRQFYYYSKLRKDNIKINHQIFPSVRTTGYVIFYKFYLDKRRPLLSDIFDITISSLYPYVDIVITERNMKEIVRKIKGRHQFLENLKIFTIKDVKNIIVTH